MKVQVRRGVFETNSSSVHTLTICSKEDFDAWKAGKLAYAKYDDCFIKAALTDKQKKEAEQKYYEEKEPHWKVWYDLTKEEKEYWYKKCFAEIGYDGYAEDLVTYDEYMHHNSYETYYESYTTKSGDEIVAFGYYGENY